MPRLDQSNWTTIADNQGPYSTPEKQAFGLFQPCDRLRISVSSTFAKGNWVRAGYFRSLWFDGDNPYITAKGLIYLAAPEVFVIEPVANNLIIFEPQNWIKDWSITIEGRPIQ